ncbi:hypothetical protein VP01_297g3 [Puccinia sorghi]|uniref:Uncharacterized protein n=1 Tax=Puccinia sorghi TaxID=27349 RepID=A0A0L6V0P1_9BASI|nr:hypothetical protein VP01_297g3 [Puccinia sorghi]
MSRKPKWVSWRSGRKKQRKRFQGQERELLQVRGASVQLKKALMSQRHAPPPSHSQALAPRQSALGCRCSSSSVIEDPTVRHLSPFNLKIMYMRAYPCRAEPKLTQSSSRRTSRNRFCMSQKKKKKTLRHESRVREKKAGRSQCSAKLKKSLQAKFHHLFGCRDFQVRIRGMGTDILRFVLMRYFIRVCKLMAINLRKGPKVCTLSHTITCKEGREGRSSVRQILSDRADHGRLDPGGQNFLPATTKTHLHGCCVSLPPLHAGSLPSPFLEHSMPHPCFPPDPINRPPKVPMIWRPRAAQGQPPSPPSSSWYSAQHVFSTTPARGCSKFRGNFQKTI